MGRIFAIGDIHGKLEPLLNILDQIKYNPEEDFLVLLGDYIDRGDKSYEAVQKVKELVNQGAVALRGNHEQLALAAHEDKEAYELWMYNGGITTILSYKENNAKIEDDLEFFASLPVVFETNNFIFVHAGLKPGIPLYQQKVDDMLWIRDEFIHSKYNWGKTVIFGHTPLKRIYFGYNKIGIDTGCFHTGILSCVELTKGEYYQTK